MAVLRSAVIICKIDSFLCLCLIFSGLCDSFNHAVVHCFVGPFPCKAIKSITWKATQKWVLVLWGFVSLFLSTITSRDNVILAVGLFCGFSEILCWKFDPHWHWGRATKFCDRLGLGEGYPLLGHICSPTPGSKFFHNCSAPAPTITVRVPKFGMAENPNFCNNTYVRA